MGYQLFFLLPRLIHLTGGRGSRSAVFILEGLAFLKKISNISMSMGVSLR